MKAIVVAFVVVLTIPSRMEETIQHQLQYLEQTHKIHILYACEAGSRQYGIQSPDSDYDVKFIYTHNLEYYLSLVSQPDYIRHTSEGKKTTATQSSQSIRGKIRYEWMGTEEGSVSL